MRTEGGKLQSVLFVCTGNILRSVAADLSSQWRDHQVFVRQQFGRDVPLFYQVCPGHDYPILDLHEVIPDWETNPERSRAYVWSVIDVIWATAPALLPRLR